MTMAHIDLGIVRGSFINARNLKTGKIEEVKYDDFCGDHVVLDASKFTNELYSSVHSKDLNMIFKKSRFDK